MWVPPINMAPEQFHGKATRKSDQYALGCIVYELLTGRRPFIVTPDVANPWISLGMQHTIQDPPPPSRFNPSIPMAIEQVILTAMQKLPDNRYASIMAFLEALGRPLPSDVVQHDPEWNIQTALSAGARTETANVYQKTVEQWLEEGERHVQAKRYEEALSAYEQATRLDSKSAEAYYQMGQVLEKKGKAYRMEALAAYAQAIYLNSKFALAYIGKGDIHFSFESYEDARKDYEEATRVAPKLWQGYYKQGRTFVKLKRYNEALSAYDTAHRYDPTNIEIYERKAKILKYLRKLPEVVEMYDQLLQYCPDYTPAYLQKIGALEELGEYDEALVTYDALLKLDPKSIDIYHGKIDLQRRLHREEGALATYYQMMQALPSFLEAYYQRAELLTHLGRQDEAVVTYDHLLRQDPTAIVAHEKKIQLLELLQRYPEALATYHQFLKFAPDPTKVFTDLINFQERHGLYEDLLVTYDQIMQQFPPALHICLSKAKLLENLGHVDDALITYEHVLQRVPEFTEAHERKIGLLEQRLRYDEALAAYDQFIKVLSDRKVSSDWSAIAQRKIRLLEYLKRDEELLEEHNAIVRKKPDAHDSYGEKIRLLEKLGRDDEALAVYDQLAQRSPNPIGIWMRKINRLEMLQRYEQAIEVCNQVVQMFPSSAVVHAKKGLLLASRTAQQRAPLPRVLTPLRNRLFPDIVYREALAAFEEAFLYDRNDSYYMKIGEMLQYLGKLNEARKFLGMAHQHTHLQDVDYMHISGGIQVVCLAVLSGIATYSWGYFLGILVGGAITIVLFALTLKRVDQRYHLYNAWILLIPCIALALAWTGASMLFFHISLWGVVLLSNFSLNALLYFLIDIDGTGKLKYLTMTGFSLLKAGIEFLKRLIRSIER